MHHELHGQGRRHRLQRRIHRADNLQNCADQLASEVSIKIDVSVNATVHAVTKAANKAADQTKATVSCAFAPSTNEKGVLGLALAAAGIALTRRRRR